MHLTEPPESVDLARRCAAGVPIRFFAIMGCPVTKCTQRLQFTAAVPGL